MPTKTDSTWGQRLELIWLAAWQRQAKWLWLFLPLSWLYGLVIFIRRYLYRSGVLSSYRSAVPVLVVGNITVGGSGKTPLIAELVRYLKQQGINVGVISRGYGGDRTAMPCLVDHNSTPDIVGDEPCMLFEQTKVALSVCPNRELAIECLLSQHRHTQLIIADDGLQHHKLQREFEWVVVDAARGFGNRQLLPTGFLREPLTRLNSADVIWHKTHDVAPSVQRDASTPHQMHLKPGAPYRLCPHASANAHTDTQRNVPKHTSVENALADWPQKTVYALSGIGYPKRFFSTLRTLGFDVIPKPMPDHHTFVVSDFFKLNDYPIIITEKDAVKISPLVKSHLQLQSLDIWVLPVRAVLSSECYELLNTQLKQLGLC